jgi:uncharacterized protein (TIGR02246 family)
MSQEELDVFATRYASAWSRQDPERFSTFFTEDGVLQINDGEPSVGRTAIAATAQSFMSAFPDMVVEKVSVEFDGEIVRFHWRWTGTHAATGRPVDMTGYEEWTFGADGMIARSEGHFDQAEYDRQMGVDQ